MNTLPSVFASIADKVSFVHRVTDNEYHSNCPQCGGGVHEDGSEPDRFVLWIVSRRGNPFGMCRKCQYRWSPTKQDANWTPEEREEFRLKTIQLEAEYEKKLAEKLETLVEKIRHDGTYHRYFEDGRKNAEVVRYWEDVRGIPLEWQEHLQKGYIGSYTVRNHLTSYQSPAYTNPVWTMGGRIENIKLRVANPIDKNDRFRNVYKSGCQHLYTAQYNKKPTNKAVILEGENKCDVVTIRGMLPEEYTIYGVQSKEPEGRILKMLSKFEVVYLAFDPDAYEPTIYYDQKTGEEKKAIPSVINTAVKIGIERVRFVIPPKNVKFDDAIAKGFKFVNAVNMAARSIP